MKAHPEWMVKDNVDGVEMVAKEDDYGFLMESKSIEYYTERLCQLQLIGEPLDDKNYGIGMRKGNLWHLLR